MNTFIHSQGALDLLREQSSPNALVPYDPAKCAEMTRLEIIQKIENWVKSDNHVPAGIFWLHGGVGAGKSAVAHTLAEKRQTEDELGAAFFFYRNDISRNTGDHFIPTVVLQLIEALPALTPFVEEKISRTRNLFSKSLQTQMVELVLEPLRKLWLLHAEDPQSSPPKYPPRLIVIDGLDECVDPDFQCDLLRLIAGIIPDLPYPLRFLVTSRPESNIREAMLLYSQNIDIQKYDLSEDPDAEKDIETFLERSFQDIRNNHPCRRDLCGWPSPSDVTTLLDRSSSHFIYAATVMRYIGSSLHQPGDRLRVILGLSPPLKDRPYAQLDALYNFIFSTVSDSDQRQKIRSALGILYLKSQQSANGGLLRRAHWHSNRQAVEELLNMKRGGLVQLFKPLLSLVSLDNDIQIFHKSLFDYLLDHSRSGDLCFDFALIHERAADYILKKRILLGECTRDQYKDFAYHCQFARLNDDLKEYLCSLAVPCDQRIKDINQPIFSWDLADCPVLPSTLYFLRTLRREDFEQINRYHSKYAKKMQTYLGSIVTKRRRLRNVISGLIGWITLRQAVEEVFKSELRDPQIQQLDMTDANRQNPVIARVASVKREHFVFSSYAEASPWYTDKITSNLIPAGHFIHTYHYAVLHKPSARIEFFILFTYSLHSSAVCWSTFRPSNPENPAQCLSTLRAQIRAHLERAKNELH